MKSELFISTIQALLAIALCQCPDPGFPKYGTRVLTGTGKSDTVTYSCLPGARYGYGDYSLSCNGKKWNGDILSCNPVLNMTVLDPISNLCYLISNDQQMINSAQTSFCHTWSSSAHLAEIRNQQQSNVISNILCSEHSRSQYYIGLNDNAVETVFVYDTLGDSLTFTNWDPIHNEPDNLGVGISQCVVLALYSNTGNFVNIPRWFDRACSLPRGVVCETTDLSKCPPPPPTITPAPTPTFCPEPTAGSIMISGQHTASTLPPAQSQAAVATSATTQTSVVSLSSVNTEQQHTPTQQRTGTTGATQKEATTDQGTVITTHKVSTTDQSTAKTTHNAVTAIQSLVKTTQKEATTDQSSVKTTPKEATTDQSSVETTPKEATTDHSTIKTTDKKASTDQSIVTSTQKQATTDQSPAASTTNKQQATTDQGKLPLTSTNHGVSTYQSTAVVDTTHQLKGATTDQQSTAAGFPIVPSSSLMPQLLTSAACSQPISGRQRSTYNAAHAYYGVDGDQRTCSTTGRHERAWFKVTLPCVTTVNAVAIKGAGISDLIIKVGAEEEDRGLRGGGDFPSSSFCHINHISAAKPEGEITDLTINCDKPIHGRFIYITSISRRPLRLSICDVSVT